MTGVPRSARGIQEMASPRSPCHALLRRYRDEIAI
jgi:hypothetical protein